MGSAEPGEPQQVVGGGGPIGDRPMRRAVGAADGRAVAMPCEAILAAQSGAVYFANTAAPVRQGVWIANR